jgi:aspartyl/glutamyl-tRNA(Asn/Gln) amidotransferase C subunit
LPGEYALEVIVPIDAAEVRRIAELDELEVDDVAPFTLARGAEQKLRADGPRSCLSVGDALANAPDAAERHFRVPRVLEAQDA